MTATTAKWGLIYPTPTDAVATVDNTVQSLAERVDLLLGESGQVVLAPLANAVGSAAVTFARDYSALGAANLLVLLELRLAPGALTWATPYPTAITATGFTANVKANVAGNYTYDWRVIAR